MEMSDKKSEIFKALNAFRLKLKQPKKDKVNPFTHSNYVDMSGVTKSIDEALDGTGIAYFQNPIANPPQNYVGIETIITHESGQYIICDPFIAPVMPNKKGNRTAQEFGSAKTYASRYSLASAFGISDGTDDDGNSASNSQANNQRPRQPYSQANRNQQSKKQQPKAPTAEQLQEARTMIAKKVVKLDELLNLSSGTTASLVVNRYGYNGDTTDVALIKKVNDYLTSEIEKQEKIQEQEGVAND